MCPHGHTVNNVNNFHVSSMSAPPRLLRLSQKRNSPLDQFLFVPTPLEIKEAAQISQALDVPHASRGERVVCFFLILGSHEAGEDAEIFLRQRAQMHVTRSATTMAATTTQWRACQKWWQPSNLGGRRDG